MAGSDDDLGMSRRRGAKDRRWSSTCQVLSGWTIGRAGDVVYDMHRAQGDKKCGFFDLASKPRSTIC
jgi:hypothetical protein